MSIELKGNDESSFSDDVAIGGDIQAGGDPGSGVVGAKIGSAGYLFGCRSGTAVVFAGHDEGDANATSIIRADGSIDAAGLLTTQGSINSNRTIGTGSVFVGLLNDVATSRINADGSGTFDGDITANNVTFSLDTGGTLDVKERLQNTQAILYRLKAALIQPDVDANQLRARLLEALDILTSDGDES